MLGLGVDKVWSGMLGVLFVAPILLLFIRLGKS